MRCIEHDAVESAPPEPLASRARHHALRPVTLGLRVGECLVDDRDLRGVDRGLGAENRRGAPRRPRAQARRGSRKSVNTASIGSTPAARAAKQAETARQRERRGIVARSNRGWRVAPSSADRSSPPHNIPASRGRAPRSRRQRQRRSGRFRADRNDSGAACGVAGFTLAISASSRSRSCGTADFGNMMPCGRSFITASRSPAHQGLSSGLTRT